MPSKIEWTDETWNPLTGCTLVSAGCKNCYAAQLAATRLKDTPRYKGLAVVNSRGVGVFTGKMLLHEDLLTKPLKWRKPRRVFVNSMSDLFHEKVPLEFIDQIFTTIKECPQHTFQVLTKRSERLSQVAGNLGWPENLWMGVSIEDARVIQRVHDLRTVPAAVRFLSCEPLIGPLDDLPLDGIHWVIVGGESGPKARPMHPDWARSLRDQCAAAGVPFFFKQWGEWGPKEDHFNPRLSKKRYQYESHAWADDGSVYDCREPEPGHFPSVMVVRVGKKRAGRLLDGVLHDGFPSDP